MAIEENVAARPPPKRAMCENLLSGGNPTNTRSIMTKQKGLAALSLIELLKLSRQTARLAAKLRKDAK